MDNQRSHLTITILRLLIRTARAAGSALRTATLSAIRWVRTSSQLGRTAKSLLIKTYDLFRHARIAARSIHPSGKLRVLILHPVTLSGITVCIFGAVIAYNLETRTRASEDLERTSIVYQLLSAEATAIIIETATPPPPSPDFASGIQQDITEGAINDAQHDDRELALFTGEGVLIRPNPVETRRGARPRDEIVRYLVQQNDTLSGIAYQYNLSVRSLLWANSLTANSYIRPGDSLIIPQTDGVMHTIQRGDTLERIATHYRSTVEKIIEINRIIKTASLEPGLLITVPDGVPPGYGQPALPRRVVARPSSPVSSQRRTPASGGSGFIWPTTGRVVTQYFSWRHGGLDIDGNLSSPIFAAADGTVEVSRGGWNGGYGNVIIIDHGRGIKTRYGHLSRLSVKAGAKVQAGEVIGIMGSTGRSTGSHLHFEAMIGGVRKNPLSYL